MADLNPAFPVFTKELTANSPQQVTSALLEKGVCYISGFESDFDRVSKEFESLHLNPDGSVRVLVPSEARKTFPAIYSTLFAQEFKAIKRAVLGMFYKDEIEIFCQHTGPSKMPPSSTLHFDKRYTFKSWYYLNDIGKEAGAMRVVPLDRCPEYSPAALRAETGSRQLFSGECTQHHARGSTLTAIDEAAEFVTGPKGILFLHLTEAWHGASPVTAGYERKILRAHSRAFSDYFLR